MHAFWRKTGINPKLVLTLVLLLGLTACGSSEQGSLRSGQNSNGSASQATVASDSQTTSTPEVQTGGQDLITAVQTVADTVSPAVVFIAITAVPPGEFLRPVPQQGVGTGVIVDRSGLILTNNHVIEGTQQIRIALPDGRSFDGTLVGSDPRTDIAVVKIQADNLPVATLGNSDQLHTGQWVVAIGNALGLAGGPTVTQGVISAVGRSVTTGDNQLPLQNMLQTDAAINPGNSGGPLVNLSGEVVGINTAVAGETGGGLQVVGIGFAIPINTVKPIADQLISQGRVTRPYMGISVTTLTPAMASQMRLSVSEGVLITSIEARSPAAQAGLKAGDVIVSIGGQNITTDKQLINAISNQSIGSQVEVVFIRGASQMTATVVLGQAP